MTTELTNQQEEIYAIYCGDINQINAQKLVASLTGAMAMGVKRVHLLFHSWGGLWETVSLSIIF